MLKRILCMMLAVSAVVLVSCGENTEISSMPENIVVSEVSVKKDFPDVKINTEYIVAANGKNAVKFTSEYKEPFLVMCSATSAYMDAYNEVYVFMENGEAIESGYDVYSPEHYFIGESVSESNLKSCDVEYKKEKNRDKYYARAYFDFETDINKNGLLAYYVQNGDNKLMQITAVVDGKGSGSHYLGQCDENDEFELKIIPKFFIEAESMTEDDYKVKKTLEVSQSSVFDSVERKTYYIFSGSEEISLKDDSKQQGYLLYGYREIINGEKSDKSKYVFSRIWNYGNSSYIYASSDEHEAKDDKVEFDMNVIGYIPIKMAYEVPPKMTLEQAKKIIDINDDFYEIINGFKLIHSADYSDYINTRHHNFKPDKYQTISCSDDSHCIIYFKQDENGNIIEKELLYPKNSDVDENEPVIEISEPEKVGNTYQVKITSDLKKPFMVSLEEIVTENGNVYSKDVFIINGTGILETQNYGVYQPVSYCIDGTEVSKENLTFSTSKGYSEMESYGRHYMELKVFMNCKLNIPEISEKTGYFVYDIKDSRGEYVSDNVEQVTLGDNKTFEYSFEVKDKNENVSVEIIPKYFLSAKTRYFKSY